MHLFDYQSGTDVGLSLDPQRARAPPPVRGHATTSARLCLALLHDRCNFDALALAMEVMGDGDGNDDYDEYDGNNDDEVMVNKERLAVGGGGGACDSSGSGATPLQQFD
jgi:hypothetical protein